MNREVKNHCAGEEPFIVNGYVVGTCRKDMIISLVLD
jgi:hypothetical protein